MEGFSAGHESLGDVTAHTRITSSFHADAVAGGDVSFGFDPAAIGIASTRTLTASLTTNPAISATHQVSVMSAAVSIRLVVPASAMQSDTITFAVDALDASGRRLGDATPVSVVTSDVDSDEIVANTAHPAL